VAGERRRLYAYAFLERICAEVRSPGPCGDRDFFLRAHDLIARVRDLHHVNVRRVEEPLGVLLQSEDSSALSRFVRAHAFENGKAVVQRMGEHMGVRVAPRHELAVVPDVPVAIRHRHFETPRVKELF
jgi:hypothetical protein